MGDARACVIIPAFQASRFIGAVLADLGAELPFDAQDLVVVDDGSTDGTSDIAARAGARVVRVGRNLGKGAALVRGLEEARELGFGVALTVDADGQHPACSAAAVLAASAAPDALVLGVRDLARDGAPRLNRFSNAVSNFALSRLAGRPLADTNCGLRRYPVARTLALGARATGYAFEAEVILRAIAAGVPVVEQPVRVIYPGANERLTHFDPVRDPARVALTILRTLHDLGWRG